MFGSEIVQYFPVPKCPHDLRREKFMSYGTCGAVNIEVEEISEGDENSPITKSASDMVAEASKHIKFISQTIRNRSDGRYELIAKTPTIPLMPPNHYHDYQTEPCISAIKQDFQKLKNTIIYLKRACARMRLKSNQMMAEDLLSKLESLDVNEETSYFDHELESDDRGESTVNHLFTGGFAHQVGILASRSKDNANTEYAGGCLRYDKSFRPTGGSHGGLLVLPSGPHLNQLNFHHLSVSKAGFKCGPEDCKLQMDGRIFEMSTATVYKQSFGVCRHGNSCSMIKMQHTDSSVNAKVITTQTFSLPEKPAAVCMSPHIPGECFIATNIGSAYLWSADDSCRSRQICKEKASQSDMLMNMWRGCHFGGHPRLAVLSDRSSVSLLDLRCSTSAFTDLCKLPQSFLEKDEFISSSCQLIHSPFYHVIGTDMSIILMDERYPNYPVLLWNHSLTSPPFYMDVVCNAMPESSDDVLLVASQDPPETHCFQFRTNSSVTRPPQAYGSPWRVSMPEDCALFAAMEGNGKGYSSTLLPRLKAPLAGMCVVPHTANNGFSVIQMTSFGDVFSQPYEAVLVDQQTHPDKTCAAGLGCESVKLSSEYVEATRSWLAEAVQQMLPVVSDVGFDAQPLMKRLCVKQVENQACPLCQPAVANSKDTCSMAGDCDVRCSSCGNSIAAACVIRNRHRCDLYPDVKDNVVLNLPNAADVFTNLDQNLKDASPSDFSDAESRLLAKLWNDNDDIEEELRERSLQDRLIMKQCGMLAEDELPTLDVEDDDYDSSADELAVSKVDSELPSEAQPAELPTTANVLSAIMSDVSLHSPCNAKTDSSYRHRLPSSSSSCSDDGLINRINESMKQKASQDSDDDYNVYLSLFSSLQPDLSGF